MTQVDFLPFNNRHIRFSLLNGIEMQGLIVDPMNYNNNIPRTVYKFIRSHDLAAWRIAEGKRDVERMSRLQNDLDILDIESAEAIQPTQ